jgi:hypothetical protein
MGDVSTHAEIAAAVMQQLPQEPETPFFEIGNWLTDVSQFRDPFAHLSGKKRIFSQGLNKVPLLPRLFNLGDLLIGIDNYGDDVMGRPPDGRVKGTRPGGDPATDRPDDGALARWFRAVLVIWTCNPKDFPPLKRQPALANLPKADIKAVFDALFTQYFPHEHLDFPPFPPNLPQRGVREPSTEQVGGQPRKLLKYSEAQLEFVADLLTKIERDWAHVAPGTDPAKRRELVARLGHASHAVEDWFFHSNFVEMAFSIARPGQPPPHAPLPLSDTTPTDIEKLGPPPTETTLRRKHHRRLRSPTFSGDSDNLSKDGSAEATACYTGSFGSDDIFFTLIDALGHLLGSPPPPDAGAKFPILSILHKTLFGTEEERKKSLEDWQKGIKNDTFVTAARVARAAGKIEDFELAAVEEICSLEKTILHRYTIIGLGILGLLQQLIDTGRQAVKKSLETGAETDNDPTHKINDGRSNNGAPGENVGCHSLMCKDSIRKEPLRQAAVNCATSVATYVAKTMTDRTPGRSPAQPNDFVDWAELLRFFVTHPAQAVGGVGNEWWRTPMAAASPPGPATGHTVMLKPAAEVGQRAEQPHLNDLEQPYYDAAIFAEHEFKKTVDREMVLDSMYTGLLTGGIIGAIAGGVSTTGPPGKVFGGTMLGSLIGAGVAGGGGALGALIGLAISRHAGVTVGSLTGITGGTVAAWFTAEAVGKAL